MANVELKSDDVTLFLCVARRYMAVDGNWIVFGDVGDWLFGNCFDDWCFSSGDWKIRKSETVWGKYAG